MKKRILALALAGTTAFSMFGGLNVFAVDANGNFVPHKDAETVLDANVFNSTTAVTIADDFAANFITDSSAEVDPAKVYLYDYDYTQSELTALKKAAAGTDLDAFKAAYAAIIDDPITATVTETGSSAVRWNAYKELTAAYDVLSQLNADELDEYGVATLKTHMGNVITAEGNGRRTSVFKYLTQEYNYFNEMYGIAASYTESLKTAYEDALEDALALVSEDYSAADFAKVEGHINVAIAIAATGDYTNAKAELDKIATIAPKKADKSELKAGLKALYTNGVIVVTAGNKYPASGTVTYPAADYVEGTGYTDAYTSFALNNNYEDAYGKTIAVPSVFESVYAVYNNSKAPQSVVDAAVEKLDDAVAVLEISVLAKDWEILRLESLVAQGEAVIPTDYKTSTSTWKGFDKALTTAQEILSKDAPGAREVASIYDTLNAYLNKVDSTAAKLDAIRVSTYTAKAELKKAIAAATKMSKDTDDITAAQMLALKDAITKGNTVYANSNALMSEVTAATEALEKAMAGYVQVQGWYKNAAGKWMYGTGETYLANGWNKIGGTWYYFNADGTAKQSEWMQEDGTWYWFTANCNAARGWAKVNGEWYFFNDGCKMRTGWVKVAGSWYYLAPSGKMVTGWVEVDGKWYYLSKEANAVGQMLANTTVDGYKLGADGAWVK